MAHDSGNDDNNPASADNPGNDPASEGTSSEDPGPSKQTDSSVESASNVVHLHPQTVATVPDDLEMDTPTESSVAVGSIVSEDNTFKHILLAGVIALFVNLIIAGLKLGVNAFISPSSALFSEGLHSLGDAINSVILLVGIVRGNRSPDRSHPFGYGLEANLWALIASFLLFFSAGWALWEATTHLLQPAHLVPHGDYYWALWVLAVSMAFEVYAIWTAARAVLAELGIESGPLAVIPNGYRYVSQAKVPTTKYVFFEDTLAFIGAFVAFTALLAGQFLVQWGYLDPQYAHIPDGIGSFLVGILLLILAIKLFIYNKGILMGSSASQSVEAAIRETVLGLYGVSHIHDLSTLDQGHSGLIIHTTVEVEPDLPVKDMDDLTERIKQRLSDKFEAVKPEQVFIEVQADDSDERWEERFEALLDEGLKRENFRPRHAALLRNAHEFSELCLRDVMVPRTDVAYVNIDMPLRELADKMARDGHTRWPVFRENVDDLMGIAHARDVFQHVLYQQEQVPLKEILRDIHIYPETKPVSDLLEEFKREKLQIAAVADEYGGFAGIVTIEDLMEEIIGDIWDENEEIETWLERLSETQVRVNGRHNLDDMNEELALNIPTDDFVTIGGYLFGQLGRQPVAGDVVIFEDVTLTIETVDGARIETVMITAPPTRSLAPPTSEVAVAQDE